MFTVTLLISLLLAHFLKLFKHSMKVAAFLFTLLCNFCTLKLTHCAMKKAWYYQREDNFHIDFHTIHCIVESRMVLYIVATRYYSTNDRYWVALPWGKVYQADVLGCKDPVVKIYFATNSIFFFSKHCKNRECFRMS